MKPGHHNLVVRVTDEELAKLHALAGSDNEPISVLVRRWLREFYRMRFGDATPPDVRLRDGKKLSIKK